MASYITIDILCSECGSTWDELMDRADINNEFTCSACGGPAKRTMSAPAVMREAHHDGYSRGDKYKINKEIARMKIDKANLPHDKRIDIDREIGIMKKVASTKRDKTE